MSILRSLLKRCRVAALLGGVGLTTLLAGCMCMADHSLMHKTEPAPAEKSPAPPEEPRKESGHDHGSSGSSAPGGGRAAEPRTGESGSGEHPGAGSSAETAKAGQEATNEGEKPAEPSHLGMHGSGIWAWLGGAAMAAMMLVMLL